MTYICTRTLGKNPEPDLYLTLRVRPTLRIVFVVMLLSLHSADTVVPLRLAMVDSVSPDLMVTYFAALRSASRRSCSRRSASSASAIASYSSSDSGE